MSKNFLQLNICHNRTDGPQKRKHEGGNGSGELKTPEQIRKQRKVQENRKAKNARPSKKGGRGRR